MEKTISPEERIRRAEEIYYRRKENSNSVRMSSSQVKEGNENRRISLYKKMMIQVLTCILIYLVFSLIKEANYIFSEDIMNKTKEFLNTDINFELIAGQVGQFFQNNQDKLDFLGSWLKEDKQESQDQTNEENSNQEEKQNQENKQEENTQSENKQEANNETENKIENKETENKVTNEAKNNNTDRKSVV